MTESTEGESMSSLSLLLARIGCGLGVVRREADMAHNVKSADLSDRLYLLHLVFTILIRVGMGALNISGFRFIEVIGVLLCRL
jgi:hypothetical protein